MERGFHQFQADISLPTNPELLLKVLERDKIVAIANRLGKDRLNALAAVSHERCVDYKAAAEQEGNDLEEVRIAVSEILGCSRPWIIGFASEFAKCLLTFA